MSDSVPGRSHSRSLSLPACVSCSLLLTSWFATVASGNLRRPIFLLDFKHSCYREVVLTLSKHDARELRYDLTALSVFTFFRGIHLQQTTNKGGQKLVAMGGGTGLSTLLAGLKRLVGKTSEEIWIESLSAIVTVS